MYNGVRYSSVREAARKENVGRTTLIHWLKANTKPGIYYLFEEAQEHGKAAIFAKKNDGPSVFFESVEACLKAGYATTDQNARRKIKRSLVGATLMWMKIIKPFEHHTH